MEAVPDLLVDGPDGAAVTVVLAHGAGAPMDSPFMTAMAGRLAARGHRVLRFEFPYMAARRLDGRRRPPDRQPALLAAEDGARGLVCLGYPFHPPGKPDRTRVEHLAGLAVPALIVQGTRDPFGTTTDVAGYRLSPAVSIAWIDDGDHDLKPRRSSGRDHGAALDEAAVAVDGFLRSLVP